MIRGNNIVGGYGLLMSLNIIALNSNGLRKVVRL